MCDPAPPHEPYGAAAAGYRAASSTHGLGGASAALRWSTGPQVLGGTAWRAGQGPGCRQGTWAGMGGSACAGSQAVWWAEAGRGCLACPRSSQALLTLRGLCGVLPGCWLGPVPHSKPCPMLPLLHGLPQSGSPTALATAPPPPSQRQPPAAHRSLLPLVPHPRGGPRPTVRTGQHLSTKGGDPGVLGEGSPLHIHMMSSRRLGLATQSRVRGSEAAMIMHMNCLPVLLSMG